ncbi:hypothetical protein Aca07nite_39130 [Actinoplanes capillaceus]|uniref:HEAT repeat-containing protein n=1 Tax=Actinoplanes campanulatus TaxID=113559 RepID=A0ABQ3WK66_9ACTN|nr:HEAT repeat domain-containing protein [Actinoplanes capillaceus]GID46638.1 hypothetical protein Aca07nite_39130 [Actinoplanes capillaceus]
MRSKLRHLDSTTLIAWFILGGIGVAIGVGIVQGSIELVRATLDAPLLVAGCIVVTVVAYLGLSAFARGAVRAAERFTAPRRAKPPGNPRRSERLFLSLGVLLFGGGGAFTVFDGFRHGLGGVVSIFMGGLAIWLGYLCLAALFTGGNGSPLPAVAVAQSPGLPVVRTGLESTRHLLNELTLLYGSAAQAALRRLSASPAILDKLFRHARQGNLTEQLRLFTAAAILPEAPALARALASTDRNGDVREKAVLAMGRRPVPEFVPFLVERAVDVVEPVRAAALEVLRELIAAKPYACRELLVRAAARVERRDHATPVQGLVAAVVRRSQ